MAEKTGKRFSKKKKDNFHTELSLSGIGRPEAMCNKKEVGREKDTKKGGCANIEL